MNEEQLKLNRLWRISILLGLLPLVTGVLIFILWYFTRWPFLEMGGAYTLVIGPIVILIALIVIGYYRIRWYKGGLPRTKLLRNTILSFIIMFMNFPAALGIICCASYLMSEYILMIENHSQTSIDDINITAPGVDIVIEHISPGEQVVRKFHFDGDGILEIHVEISGKKHRETIEGYVTGGMGGKTTVAFYDDGQFKIISSEMLTD